MMMIAKTPKASDDHARYRQPSIAEYGKHVYIFSQSINSFNSLFLKVLSIFFEKCVFLILFRLKVNKSFRRYGYIPSYINDGVTSSLL